MHMQRRQEFVARHCAVPRLCRQIQILRRITLQIKILRVGLLPPLIGVIGSAPAPTESPSETAPYVTSYGATTAH